MLFRKWSASEFGVYIIKVVTSSRLIAPVFRMKCLSVSLLMRSHLKSVLSIIRMAMPALLLPFA